MNDLKKYLNIFEKEIEELISDENQPRRKFRFLEPEEKEKLPHIFNGLNESLILKKHINTILTKKYIVFLSYKETECEIDEKQQEDRFKLLTTDVGDTFLHYANFYFSP